MTFMNESSNYDKVKLEIYERYHSGYITESQKDLMLEEVLRSEMQYELFLEEEGDKKSKMQKTLAIAAAAVATSLTMIFMARRIYNRAKVNSKIKASPELAAINTEIKRCNQKLKMIRKDISITIKEYQKALKDTQDRRELYSKKKLKVPEMKQDKSGKTYVSNVTSYNPYYNKSAANLEKAKADKINMCIKQYMQKSKELDAQVKELNSIKSKFLNVVKKDLGDEEYAKIKQRLDTLSEKMQ